MNTIQSLLGQFLGEGASAAGDRPQPTIGQGSSGLGDRIPGGLVGGAAAGGIIALLLGNKKARKFAGKAAGYGGAAVIGGLAYQALQNWRKSPSNAQHPLQAAVPEMKPSPVTRQPAIDDSFEVKVITAMIAAAKADGHIDGREQERIFAAVDQMALSSELKALVFDLLRKPVSAEDVSRGVESLEQKVELYMASCLAIDEDHPRERAYLDQLAGALALPESLASQISAQARLATENEPSAAGNVVALPDYAPKEHRI